MSEGSGIGSKNKRREISFRLWWAVAAAMMLRYSLDMPEEAAAIEEAVNKTLESGLRTGDIMEEGMTRVGCTAMGEAIVKMIG